MHLESPVILIVDDELEMRELVTSLWKLYLEACHLRSLFSPLRRSTHLQALERAARQLQQGIWDISVPNGGMGWTLIDGSLCHCQGTWWTSGY